jgi:anti-sigma-K factor RskA
VSGCRSQAELIGPYVLGALEPVEMEEMRAHLETCARCAAEVQALAALPTLLDQVKADEPVATPRPELEDEVLDRFVRDRAAAGVPASRRPRRQPAWRPGWRPLAAAAAVAAALVVAALVVAWPGDDDSAYARAELEGRGGQAVAWADAVDAGTRVRVRADSLPRGMYELWCVREDGRWISGGSFHARADGTTAADLTAAVWPGEYHLVVITRRSTGGERGAEVMRGELKY